MPNLLVQGVQIVLQLIGLLATVGVLGWIARKIRRGDVIVAIEFIPNVIPLAIMEQISNVVAAAERRPDAILDPRFAAAIKDVRYLPNEINKLVITVRNRARKSVSGLQLYFHQKWLPDNTALSYLLHVNLQGPLKPEQRREFLEKIGTGKEVLALPVPSVPPQTAITIEIYGAIAQDFKPKLDAPDHLKWKVRRVITIPKGIGFKVLLSQDARYFFMGVLAFVIGAATVVVVSILRLLAFQLFQGNK